jgi:raffinose synthase
MDMTNDAFLNFGGTPVARSVEDYFPYKAGEGYDLQHGNAAAHVLQAMYNAIYFGEWVFPDFDMFESTNPNASLHAVVRAANCAPIYITDRAGQHDVALLTSLVDAEGLTLRASTPLRPVADCLFQIQAPRLFKASSRSGEGALLLLANLADIETVAGAWRVSDVSGLPEVDYAVWSPATDALSRPTFDQVTKAQLKRFGHDLLHVAPVIEGTAVIGLKTKLNGLASVRDIRRHGGKLSLTVRDGGTLLLWRDTAPASVRVDGQTASFTFAANRLEIALDGPRRARQVEIA